MEGVDTWLHAAANFIPIPEETSYARNEGKLAGTEMILACESSPHRVRCFEKEGSQIVLGNGLMVH